MANCEFARKQLKKHGWKEGSGLGREEHGRAEAIKVTLKMDKAGMGHDPAKEFTDHWWMRAFNDAAKQTGVKKEKKVESKEVKSESVQSARKKRFYAGFVKSSVLSNGVEERDKDKESTDEEDENKPVERLPTLDELHKYCDGATGHRASMALGGVKMSGKLARVAEADRLFELRMREKNKQPRDTASPGEDLVDSQERPFKKKKKKRQNDNEDSLHEISTTPKSEDQEKLEMETFKKKKKKKKKEKNTDDKDLSNLETASIENNDVQQSEENDEVQQKKKKKKRKKQETEVEDELDKIDEDESKKKKKKKKKNNGDVS